MRNDEENGENGVYGKDGDNGGMLRDSVCEFFIFYSTFISVT